MAEDGSDIEGFGDLFPADEAADANNTNNGGGAAADDATAWTTFVHTRASSSSGGAHDGNDDIGRVPLEMTRSASKHSLWGNELWNAARYLIEKFDDGSIPVRGRAVLELGSGLGAPSLVAAANGARWTVVTDYPEPAVMDLLARNIDTNRDRVVAEGLQRLTAVDAAAMKQQQQQLTVAGGDDGTDHPPAPSEEELARRAALMRRLTPTIDVLPLLWGNGEHLSAALEKTGGSGFDVVILSDLVFNHICHDALLWTVSRALAKTPTAAAYAVFSHHRPRKVEDDLNFFKLAPQYGLEATLIDTRHDFPLMFPDDPGDPAVRQPVYCWSIRHRHDSAGPPTEDVAVDVVVVGTGLVEAAVSAACARAQLRVLHLDGAQQYGSAFTGGALPQFEAAARKIDPEGFRSFRPRASRFAQRLVEQKEASSFNVASEAASESGSSSAALAASLREQLRGAEAILASRAIAIDLNPLIHLADGPLVRRVAESQIGPQLNFHNLCRLATIDAQPGGALKAVTVPLSRSAAFKSKALGPMDMRRLMTFVKDLTANMPSPVAEEPDRPPASDDDEDDAEVVTERIVASMTATLYSSASAGGEDRTLAALMTKTYKLSPSVVKLLTLDGRLCDPSAVSAESGVRLLHRYLTSVGKFGGATPYLVSLYGAGELPQQLCRMSAVWTGVFVLGRSIAAIEAAPASDDDDAGGDVAEGRRRRRRPAPATVMRQTGVFARSPDGAAVVLTNGQRVKARCVVADRSAFDLNTGGVDSAQTTTDADDVVASRVVVLVEDAAIAWPLLEPTGPPEDDAAEQALRRDFDVPLVACSFRFSTSTTAAGAESGGNNNHPPKSVVATVVQLSNATDQAPAGCSLLHFTCAAADASARQLADAVSAAFGWDFARDDVTSTAKSDGDNPVHYVAEFTCRRSMLARAAVTVDAGHGTAEAPTPLAAPVALGRRHRLISPLLADPSAAPLVDDDEVVRVVPVQTVFAATMDDTPYIIEAHRAYFSVLHACGKPGDTPFLVFPSSSAQDDAENEVAEENRSQDEA